jgi:hypothetical protein
MEPKPTWKCVVHMLLCSISDVKMSDNIPACHDLRKICVIIFGRVGNVASVCTDETTREPLSGFSSNLFTFSNSGYQTDTIDALH